MAAKGEIFVTHLILHGHQYCVLVDKCTVSNVA